MQLNICFMLSLLLVVVAAFPARKGRDPSSWITYRVIEEPDFPPPDIGPLYLPREFFKDYPHLSENQKQGIRVMNGKEHRRQQQEIAEQWRRTGKPPTNQELKDRAERIKEMLRRLAKGSTIRDRTAEAIWGLKKQIQMRRNKIETARARAMADEMIVQESEQRIADAETSIGAYEKEIEVLRAQIERLRDEQTAFPYSQEYIRIDKKIRETVAKLNKLTWKRDEAEYTARNARSTLRYANPRKKGRLAEIERLEGEIRELTEQLKALGSEEDANPEADRNPDSNPETEARTQDRNSLSMTGLGNGARRMIKGVGGFLLDVNRRMSTGEAGSKVHLRPFPGALPKSGLVGIP